MTKTKDIGITYGNILQLKDGRIRIKYYRGYDDYDLERTDAWGKVRPHKSEFDLIEQFKLFKYLYYRGYMTENDSFYFTEKKA